MSEPSVKSPTIFPLPNDPSPSTSEPNSPDLMARFMEHAPMKRAEFYIRSGSPYSALRELQEIISGNPDAEQRALCYLRAGQIREQTGNTEAARACYEEAISPEPKDKEVAYFAFNNLAYCLNRLGQSREAEGHARRAVAISPDRFNAHKNLGIALEKLGHFPEAAESLLAAVRIHPDHPVSVRRLRVILATHPTIGRDRPDLAREVEDLLARGRRDWPQSKPIPREDLESTIRELLASIEVDEATVEGDFQVFGLHWRPGNGLEYKTLDDAMAEKMLEVTEVNKAGSVPRIRVVNRSKQNRVFLMAGEQLVGAKQNRVLNASILLDARSDLPLPVSCVEAGRWAYRGPRFESRGSSSHYMLRHIMAKKAHYYYKSRGTPETDQGEVWQEVSRKLSEFVTVSPSQALDDVYQEVGKDLDRATERLEPRAHWCGAAFCFAGKIVGVDLFDRPATLHKQWPKLTRAYALDVLRRKGASEVSRKQVEDWIRGSSNAVIDVFPSTGLGVDCRLESNHHVGSVLVIDGRPLHLEMFHEEEM
ncbi:MAG TPA: DUF6569 family protein [Candidatus Eisenbacteria bacterium]|nr:DUF6569 family protein [Candidatus Eisenbacteria bacterium]